MALFDFIAGWDHPHRRHSALGYQSPIDYERYYGAEANKSCGARPPRAPLGRQKTWRPARCTAPANPKPLSFPAPDRVKGGAE